MRVIVLLLNNKIPNQLKPKLFTLSIPFICIFLWCSFGLLTSKMPFPVQYGGVIVAYIAIVVLFTYTAKLLGLKPEEKSNKL